ncbi:histidine kinase [Photobacterium aquae]|uniref:Histidine kinase n=1 Tax=Photobacterium aquae TaxID=1195763 RepID=A0A0J1HBU2_9GAMM|nr:HDOD domain-containing protein [Photobacterium aquae]KLV09134.1 histidine kinase [Photobacterium aquae]
MNSYLARQPILNKNKETIGYELLFRDGPNNCFPEVEDEHATHRLLADNFLTSSTAEVTAGKRAFVNFPYSSLIKRTPLLFPKHCFIIEILESCQPSDELLEAIIELNRKGYTLALDDFIPSPEWLRFLPYIHIIKFDIKLTPIAKAGFFIRRQRILNRHLQFLAEKVETYEEFITACDNDFDFFQGFFFSRPELVTRKALTPSALTTLQLYREITKPEVNFNTVEAIIATDVSLSYKLLRHVNNMTVTLAKPISSFKQALVYLGEEKLRRFITFVATSHAAENKPLSLYLLSLQRARFCEQVSNHLPDIDNSQAFLVGLFSLLDSILDQPIELLLEQLPLDSHIHHALINRQGDLGALLELICSYEEANWTRIQQISATLGVSESVVGDLYLESIKWATIFEKRNAE